MSEKDFCSFVYKLCQMFVPDRFNSKLGFQTKGDPEKAFEDMLVTMSDVSKLFSYFNAYEIKGFNQYQEQIKEQYQKQRGMIKKFFEIESFEGKEDKQKVPNMFYKMQAIENLCMAVINTYFDVETKNNEENLKFLLARSKNKINLLDSEENLRASNEDVYHQIVMGYVVPLLPFNKFFLNCLEEEDVFLFSRLIINELGLKEKDANTPETDFIAYYEIIIGLYAVINSYDGDFEELLKDNDPKKTEKAFYEILINTFKNRSQDKLKEKYGIYGEILSRELEESTKDKIEVVASYLAENFNESYMPNVLSKNALARLSRKLSLLAPFTDAIVSCIGQAILDKIFPVQIKNIKVMQQKSIEFLFALNRHNNAPYATCVQGSKYLTFPIEIVQTLISADLRAMILGGSALNSGFCVHTPSIAFFNQDSQNSLKSLKESLRHFMSTEVAFTSLGGRNRTTIKEAYAKLWYYLDMGENQDIKAYLENKLQTKPSYYTLENLSSDKYVRTRLKKAKELDDRDENFIEVEGNAKGGVQFNRDFLIQLKRVAEWNYGIYKNGDEDGEDGEDGNLQKRQLCGNLIYNEDYIPTTIDILE